jgi:hypothetical protein
MSSFSRFFLRDPQTPNDRVRLRCETTTPPSPDSTASAGDVCIIKDGASSTVLQYDGSAWNSIAGGGDPLGYFEPLATPETANAADVECSESVAGLTLWNPSSNSSTLTFDNGTALLTAKRRSANAWAAAYKTVPSGSWSAWSKVTLQAPSDSGERLCGMIIWDSAPDTSSDFQYVMSYSNSTTQMNQVYVQSWTNWETFSATQVNAFSYPWIANGSWFRVRYDSSTPRLSYDISNDGISWNIVHTTTSPLFTPTHVGILGSRVSATAAHGDAEVRFPFLRFSASADFDQLCLGRVI